MKLTKQSLLGTVVAGLALAVLGHPAKADVYHTGFVGDAAQPFQTITANQPNPADSMFADNWTVDSGSIDYINGYWQSADGDGYSVDLAGGEPGSISHDLATTAGQLYDVTFYLAGNPDGAPTVKNVKVGYGSQSQQFTFDDTGSTELAMGWKEYHFQFVGDGTTGKLSFKDTDTGTPYGAALDDITVNAVPELGTSVGFGSLVLFGGLALLRRRTRQIA